MKYLFNAVLVAFCGIGSASAAVVTSTTCSVGTQMVSHPTNCAINSPNNAPPNTVASAAASITINQLTTLPASGGLNSFTVDVAGSATAIPVSNIGSGPNIGSSAASTATITDQFLTGGPVRPGVITLSSSVRNLQSGPGNDSDRVAVSIGSLADSCGGIGGFCNGFLSTPGPRSFGFTLGNTFTFSFSENYQAMGDPYVEGPGFASGAAGLTFQLFEADGKTPVAISAAPEPGTLGLLLTCLGGVGAACALRRARRSS